MVRIDLSGAKEFTPNVSNEEKALDAIRKLKDGSGAGSDFIGWVDLPVSYDKDEFARIQKAAPLSSSASAAATWARARSLSFSRARTITCSRSRPRTFILPETAFRPTR